MSTHRVQLSVMLDVEGDVSDAYFKALHQAVDSVFADPTGLLDIRDRINDCAHDSYQYTGDDDNEPAVTNLHVQTLHMTIDGDAVDASPAYDADEGMEHVEEAESYLNGLRDALSNLGDFLDDKFPEDADGERGGPDVDLDHGGELDAIDEELSKVREYFDQVEDDATAESAR